MHVANFDCILSKLHHEWYFHTGRTPESWAAARDLSAQNHIPLTMAHHHQHTWSDHHLMSFRELLRQWSDHYSPLWPNEWCQKQLLRSVRASSRLYLFQGRFSPTVKMVSMHIDVECNVRAWRTRWEMRKWLTPGLIVMQIKPSLARSLAYWTVSMLRAALDILYAGTGNMANLSEYPNEPRVLELLGLLLVSNSGPVNFIFEELEMTSRLHRYFRSSNHI